MSSGLKKKILTISGEKVTLYSRDGKNYSMNPDDLPSMEEADAKVERESLYWDIPGAKKLLKFEDGDEL